jgi:hypothetical protein
VDARKKWTIHSSKMLDEPLQSINLRTSGFGGEADFALLRTNTIDKHCSNQHSWANGRDSIADVHQQIPPITR